jgi:gamma-glutamyl:cysteine ligase YbdK (ATP-grasp superfamily)
MNDTPLHLFDAMGIELEYMIVDRRDLCVRPVADRVLMAVAGDIVSEIELGPLAWSNELVLHVIELKTNGPVHTLAGLHHTFERHLDRINGLLLPLDARLMPTACHPWMDPQRETVLWPHEYSPVYEAYDRIFGCKGHGWSNLQSMHINLPFHGDDEFARLHAAIRLLLPVMPALTAASPILDGRPTGFMDARMEVYRHNAERIPSIAGSIVPEPVYTRADYERQIFQRMYADIAPFDPDGTLQHEFLNSRGAISRFDRGAIEIRVLDIQECPRADLAAAALIAAALKALCDERWVSLERLKAMATPPLADLFLRVIREADQTVIEDKDFLQAVGMPPSKVHAREIWQHLAETTLSTETVDPDLNRALESILAKGCLARRISRAAGAGPSRDKLRDIYRALCDCLAEGEQFL